ncbi:MAG: ACT domain-containing protein [Planctomycetes bacterium]|nr:ACT domain-containing protein [Planctomycetota bacterium]
MAKKKESQICIITVTGNDKVGIIAKISNACARATINIVDVNQKIMEQYFVMTMACDITDATAEIDKLHKQLGRLGEDMDLNITFQHENIFKMMHRM